MKDCPCLLVVEDEDSEYLTFTRVLRNCREGIPLDIRAVRATNLVEALQQLPRAELVITDLFFPSSSGATEIQPNGLKVIEWCLNEKKPVVCITAEDHHSEAVDPHCIWGREHGIEFFDGTKHLKSGTLAKCWMNALYGVLVVAVGLDKGFFVIENQILYQRNYMNIRHRKDKVPLNNLLQSTVSVLFDKQVNLVALQMLESGFTGPAMCFGDVYTT